MFGFLKIIDGNQNLLNLSMAKKNKIIIIIQSNCLKKYTSVNKIIINHVCVHITVHQSMYVKKVNNNNKHFKVSMF